MRDGIVINFGGGFAPKAPLPVVSSMEAEPLEEQKPNVVEASPPEKQEEQNLNVGVKPPEGEKNEQRRNQHRHRHRPDADSGASGTVATKPDTARPTGASGPAYPGPQSGDRGEGPVDSAEAG